MNAAKIGRLILSLRKEKGLTQSALAARIGVSDKAVSKWERGLGCPDLSLLPALSKEFSVPLDALLAGDLGTQEEQGGNMKNTLFYVCPDCHNIVTSSAGESVSCCGKTLSPLVPHKALPEEKLSVESIEMEYFVSSNHEMSKEHYISFLAFLTGESLLLRKLYPEWDMQARLPCLGHGKLLWYCTQHGLCYQLI